MRIAAACHWLVFIMLILVPLPRVCAQDDSPWDIKVGATVGAGVNTLVRRSFVVEGIPPSSKDWPNAQIGQSSLLNLYAEVVWRDQWGASLGLEGNLLDLRQNVVAGNYVQIQPFLENWNQVAIPILFSKYFSVGPFPNKLKVSMGPRISFYRIGQVAASDREQNEWVRLIYTNWRRVHAGIRGMVMWHSPISQRSSLNIGLGLNYDWWGPIRSQVFFYRKSSGTYDLDREPRQQDLVYWITNTVRPLQYLFTIQWEISCKQ